jgi:hypothetical protein
MLAGISSGGRLMNRAIVIALALAVAAPGSAQKLVAPAPRPVVGEVLLLLMQTSHKDRVDRLVRVRFRDGVVGEPETI